MPEAHRDRGTPKPGALKLRQEAQDGRRVLVGRSKHVRTGADHRACISDAALEQLLVPDHAASLSWPTVTHPSRIPEAPITGFHNGAPGTLPPGAQNTAGRCTSGWVQSSASRARPHRATDLASGPLRRTSAMPILAGEGHPGSDRRPLNVYLPTVMT
jgi:hypothetical protein